MNEYQPSYVAALEEALADLDRGRYITTNQRALALLEILDKAGYRLIRERVVRS